MTMTDSEGPISETTETILPISEEHSISPETVSRSSESPVSSDPGSDPENGPKFVAPR